MKIYTNQTSKPLTQFVKDINAAAGRRGFKINNGDKMDMAAIFTNHGIDTPETFDMHMIQLCKPEKASKSLFKNPERIVLIPKFIMAFSEGGMTQIPFPLLQRGIGRQADRRCGIPQITQRNLYRILSISSKKR